MQFKPAPQPVALQPQSKTPELKQQNFFRTMTAQEFKTFTGAIAEAPQPKPEAAKATALKVEHAAVPQLNTPRIAVPFTATQKAPEPPTSAQVLPEPQAEIPLPEESPWRVVGELYRTYIIVEQGEEAYLIDKHAAHERILFEKLKANQEAISSQSLLAPVPCRLSPESIAIVLSEDKLLQELGFELEAFGDNTILVRRIPMDLGIDQITDTLDELAANLLNGRREKTTDVRDEVLHTVACKAAIKAGWKTDSKELHALVQTVMSRQELKYCPHGRPICITLSKKQLEKQFKR